MGSNSYFFDVYFENSVLRQVVDPLALFEVFFDRLWYYSLAVTCKNHMEKGQI